MYLRIYTRILSILRGFSDISCFVMMSNNKKVFSLISLKKKKCKKVFRNKEITIFKTTTQFKYTFIKFKNRKLCLPIKKKNVNKYLSLKCLSFFFYSFRV